MLDTENTRNTLFHSEECGIGSVFALRYVKAIYGGVQHTINAVSNEPPTNIEVARYLPRQLYPTLVADNLAHLLFGK